MVAFGQLIVGPPGAGKTTFVDGMQQLLSAINRPNVITINLDFANDDLPYECTIDVKELTTVVEAMSKYKLGPNGGLLWCMEYLLANIDWLLDKIQKAQVLNNKEGSKCDPPIDYLLIDCPGQVELYTHHNALKEILEIMTKRIGARLAVVHLMDSVLCAEPSHFISGLLVSLSGQLHLEMPHINLLTKVDLLRKTSEDLVFQLEYYAEVQDLRQLLEYMRNQQMDHPMNHKFLKLQEGICEIVEDFNMVGFMPLAVEEKDLMLAALKQIDTANGYSLNAYCAQDPLGLFRTYIGPANSPFSSETYGTLQEKYIDPELGQSSDDITN